MQEPTLQQRFTATPITLQQLCAIFRAWWRFITLSAFGLASLALVYSLLSPKVYDATAQILVDFDVNDPITDKPFPSQLASSYLSTQVDMVNSPRVLLPVVDSLGWIKDSERLTGFKQQAGGGGPREFLMEKVLAKNLSVRTLKDSRLIYVGYQAESAAEAALVANAVANTYIEESRQSVLRPLKERSSAYLVQLKDLKKNVDEAQVKVTEFRNQTGLIELSAQDDTDTQALRQMEAKLTETQLTSTLAAERKRLAERDRQNAAVSDTQVEFLNNPYVQNLKGQLVAAEGNFAELAKTLGPMHPDYIAKQAEIASLRDRLSRENALFYGSVNSDAEKTSRTTGSLSQAITGQRKRVLATRSQQEQGAVLVRDLEAAKKVYDRAIEAYDRILLPAQGSYSNASLLAPALPPLKQSKPIVRNNLLLGFIAGGLFGAIAALLLELRRRKVRCADDILEITGHLPLLRLGAAV